MIRKKDSRRFWTALVEARDKVPILISMWWWTDWLAGKSRSSVLPRFTWRRLAGQLDLPPPTVRECGARDHKRASSKATTQGVALKQQLGWHLRCLIRFQRWPVHSLSILALPQKLQQTRYTKHHTIKTLIFSLSWEKVSLMMFTEHSSKQMMASIGLFSGQLML